MLIRKRKRSHTKRKKRVRVALIVLAVVVLVGGGAAWGVMSTIKAGEGAIREAAQAEDIQTAENAVTYDEGKTVKYNGHTYALNENMVSVCIIGFDRTAPAEIGERAGQADAVMVMALNTDTGKITAIGLPRDSMVEVGEFVGDAFIGLDKMQLCLAYSYGDGRDTSCQYTTTVASRMLYNMPISYYFALDLSGVGPLNDSIGGVALTPLQSIPNTGIVEGEDTVLFGSNALKYVQWRDTSVLTSSLDRQARQVQYIKAFAGQTLEAAQGSVGTLIDIFNTAGEYSITNLGVNEFSYLATSVLSNGITGLDVVTLTGEMKQGEKYAEYYLDKNATYETVLSVYYHQVD
ncbi:LCP family protein [Gordonibacter massiliensis (ex Traore et al. 2017)]|uniref:LCP family protein n=1 Tax=Gordonibacter massiliensis (ex Traore et al. 2017) TaxID=1841863 RepID=A0A842JL87_9ACTN|nr:LCP family protein [Gordonibacter massiliensis (ex Traore et al. 2017)]